MAKAAMNADHQPLRSFECLVNDFCEFRAQGLPAALVTLVNTRGGSPRPPGSQMVIGGDGRFVGHLTGGCAEHVIVDEAQAALREGRNRTIRLGAGSPYLDIELPCGASVDLHIDVGVADEVMAAIKGALDERRTVALEILPDGGHQLVRPGVGAVPPGAFRRWYRPARRLLVFGKGPNASALARLAWESEYQVQLLSPDRGTLGSCSGTGIETTVLTAPSAVDLPPTDAHTAAVVMFHEHDWEPPLLAALLKSDVFYIGALGSRRTHEQRCDSLAQQGFGIDLDRIRGPVGLDIGAATPIEIALSILAEITRDYRASLQRPLLETRALESSRLENSGDAVTEGG
ncbi:xanthine dehydrogenase accessory factor [Marinobacter daqiaonensis]|uniref:Xanthine dehydrogenase accessory factor n=1 Tax=Marinobacter daqiaonensis TaxID=650891 RepID=A0A1I6JFQ8_9GAMM|nr:XdhC family protein [Marinobacter daqiaonensis]SFR77826.1 xanthine dehydrogenase accessory factor [Marinobacter daqiaonensis]